MKTIKGLDEKLDVFSLEDKGEKDKLSFRDIYRTILSLSLSNSGAQAMEMVDVAMVLKAAKEDATLEDSQFNLLKEKIEANPMKQPAFFLAQLLRKLKVAEETK